MKNTKSVHTIIHAAASSAACVGAGLAQLPGADMPVIAGIQTTMIITIANKFGAELSEAAAMDMLLTATASYGGRALSQYLVGWIPGWGNSINASTAFALTEAVGWAAEHHFSSNDKQYSST
ncbi:hypothetical protein [Psychromonas sp. SA13A]|uniref:hypothetical protein n=1 Tax=Psychromonas sp. SA13A TaxID=2686346 RepID=UPI00140C122D|nr:hypothetical protein [Psychromonas sp. SA13A]